MSKPHPAAVKAAHRLRTWVTRRTSVHKAAPELTEQHLTDMISSAIDEATAEKQERIDALVDALEEARVCLLVEGYSSSRSRQGHTVMRQIGGALTLARETADESQPVPPEEM